MKQDDKAKELTKSPFKGESFNKVLELFLKMIEKIKSSTADSEIDAEIFAAMEKELTKSKDPIETWVKGTALEVLDYVEMAKIYKDKACELGYKVDSVMENVNPKLDEFTGKRIQLISLQNNVENLTEGLEGIVESVDTESNIMQVKWDNGMKTPVLPEDKFKMLLPKAGEKQVLMFKDEVNAGVENAVTTTKLEGEPEYDKSALIQLIASDAFYKFFYRELGDDIDQDKNLEKFYKTYVKNDEAVLQKLKTFESYVKYMKEKGTL